MTKKILIVDDEPNIVISLEFLMRREGFEITVARDGEEALGAIAQENPDLVLLDVMMPKFNGFEVCEKVRTNPEYAGMRIIMLTAKGREAEVSKGLSLGADGYITKPFSTRDLVEQVKNLLGLGAP